MSDRFDMSNRLGMSGGFLMFDRFGMSDGFNMPDRFDKQTNNNDLLEKNGGTKNCIYKD